MPTLPSMINEFGVQAEAPKSRCNDCSRGHKCHTPCLTFAGTPGLPVLVLEAPTGWEDDEQKPMVAPEGLLIKSLLKGMGYPPGSYNVVYAVACNGAEVTEEHAVSCRKYLRYKLEQLQPSVILSFGSNCGFSLTGENYDEKSVRKGFRWLSINGTPTKVCLLMSETDLVANSTKVNPMKEDLRWALNTKNTHKQYSYVSVQDEFDSGIAHNAVAHAHYTAFDIEASGTQHDNDYRITCIAFWPVNRLFDQASQSWYLEEAKEGYVFHLDSLKLSPDWELIRANLITILTSCDLVGWNSKYDAIGCMVDPDIAVKPNVISDTRIKRKLLEADADGTLATAAELIGLGGHKQEAEDVLHKICTDLNAIRRYYEPSIRKKKVPPLSIVSLGDVPRSQVQKLIAGVDVKTFAYGYLPQEICERYNALDTLTNALLEMHIDARLDADKRSVWDGVCKPAMLALTDMEHYGIGIDLAQLKLAEQTIAGKIATVEASIRVATGDPNFNPGSPIQVRKLMGTLGLKVKKKTLKGQIATSEMALEPFKHVAVIADILEYRRLNKLLGTYCNGLASCVVNGRIHASFLQGGTETGRVSCFNPNLQNIPTATSSFEAKLIRDAFVAGPGRCFVEADYGQLEIRIAAWLSEDPKMIEVLRSGVDFHQRTAEMICWVWGVGPDGIDEEKRKEAKTANFAVLYELPDRLGMMLANRLKCDRAEGQKIADAIFGAFSRLRQWMGEQLAYGQKIGGTHTYWNGLNVTPNKLVGRFRPLWKLGTSIPEELGIKDSHKRSTWNGAVQGTAGDLATASLLEIQQQLDEHCPGARVVVTIHDSITVECEEQQAPMVASILKKVMTRYKLLTSLTDSNGNNIEVPLVVDFKKGNSWGSMQKYKPENV